MKRNPIKKVSYESNLNVDYFLIRVTLLTFKLLGLAPLGVVRRCPNVEKNDNPKIESSLLFVCSRANCIFNVSLIAIIIGICFACIPRIGQANWAFKTQLLTTIEATHAVAGIAIIILLWSMTLMKQNIMAKLLNRLAKFDEINWHLLNASMTRTSRVYTASMFLINFIVWIIVAISDFLGWHRHVIEWFNDIIPCIIVSWLFMQYTMMVKLIETRFNNLNNALADPTRSAIVTTFRSTINGHLTPNDSCYPKIIDYRRAHTALYEIASEISEFYSLPILTVVTLNCYAIVYNAYFFIIPFVIDDIEDPSFRILNSISWLFGLILPIFALTTTVNRTINEMKMTASAIHKVSERPNTTCEERIELKQFSIELLHRKIDFTASGLFPLDCTLLHSIVSMVVTYLIILLQLQMSRLKNDTPIPVVKNVTNVN